ncbi:MAG: pyridoxal phosphate-dependent class II aminotransferase [Candidatus Eremiobacteraeota bacterium]|nr:pyridoxal phosphate-dependent class II aminotransferase [Candidatus Eremiobacteraeota bacterium]
MATHGGNLGAVARAFDVDPRTLIDFSANINPAGPPPGVVGVLHGAAEHPQILAAYPDPDAAELIAALAQGEGIAPERTIVGNGGAALLDAAIRALAPRRCILPVPAFSEYARALAANGVAAVPFPLRADDDFRIDVDRLVVAARAEQADLCVFSNPHNPSGGVLPRANVLTLARTLAERGCATIVDEAFVDYVPAVSVADAIGDDEPIIVLRSLTKFYAIPAMRVGYAFAPPALAARVRAAFPSWPVGTLDQHVALAALMDDTYAIRTRSENAREREHLARRLTDLGCRVFPAAANFLLVDIEALRVEPEELRTRLIRRAGIVIRTFPDDPALRGVPVMRVAVRSRADNERLVEALALSRGGSAGSARGR